MHKTKKIIILLIVIILGFSLFKTSNNFFSKEHTSISNENNISNDINKNEDHKIVPKKESLPSTLYVSELITLRDNINGKPLNSLTIGSLVNILKSKDDWFYISEKNSNTKGWVEKKHLIANKLEDKNIFETKKILTKVPVEVVKDNNEDENNTDETPQQFKKIMVDTDINIKDLYQLGDVQFKSINKQIYEKNPKENVKAIYISLNGMYHIDDYIKLAKESDINTFVLDIKNDHGRTLFESPIAHDTLKGSYIRPRIKEIEKLMTKLRENNIYTVGRISIFKDEAYVNSNPNDIILDKRYNRAYQSSDGIPWLSPYNRNVWYYNVELAKEAADFGFNEILFDYVRFPDRVQNLEKNSKLIYDNIYSETKPEVIQSFLKYSHDELSKKEVYLSASVFGQIGISKDDENLGQHWESISNVVDSINPMAYPSHYARGTYGLKNPDNSPFKLLNAYSKEIILRNKNLDNPAVIETWIQGFSAPWVKGHIKYKGKELREQIKALKIEGLDSYLVWNASSRYYWDGFKIPENTDKK